MPGLRRLLQPAGPLDVGVPTGASRLQWRPASPGMRRETRESILAMTEPRKLLCAAVLIAVLAFGVRLLHVQLARECPFLTQLVGDAASYWDWATGISEGDWIGSEGFYQAPAYPYVLAVSFAVFGEDVRTVQLLQILGGSIGVGLLCWGTGRFLGLRVGVLAGLMLAFYGPAVFFDGIIQKASLSSSLLCLLVALMAAISSRFDRLAALGLGVTAAALSLTRENALAWLPVLLLWLVLLGRYRQQLPWLRVVGWGALYIAGLAVVLLPVAGRNAYVTGSWAVSTFQFGPNFYIGNSEDADGRYRPLVRGHETPSFERRDATRLAEAALGHELGPREVSQYWAGRAWDDIREAPGRWLRLLGMKLLMVWNRYEVSDVESSRVYAEYSWFLRGVSSVWHFGVLAPVAVVGIVLTRSRWRDLWVFYVLLGVMTASVAAFYVLGRYRYPLVPLLVMFAAAGIVEFGRLAKARRWGALAVAAVAGCVAALVANWPIHDERRLDTLAYMNLGVSLAQQGDLEAGTGWLRRAVELHEGSVEAHFNLGQALALAEDDEAAIREYEAALMLEPSLAEGHVFAALALERVGRLEAALGHYRRAAELNPKDTEARAAIRRLEGE